MSMHWWCFQHLAQGLAQPGSINVHQSGMNPGHQKENLASSLTLLAVASWLQDFTHPCALLLQSACSGTGIRSLGTFPVDGDHVFPPPLQDYCQQQGPQSPWENSPHISSPAPYT